MGFGPNRALAFFLSADYGYGNLPFVDPHWRRAVRELVAEGKVVAVGSQTYEGTVDLERYQGGRALREAGAVGIGDMTLPAAAVKLMYLLGSLGSAEEVRDVLGRPIAGEIAG